MANSNELFGGLIDQIGHRTVADIDRLGKIARGENKALILSHLQEVVKSATALQVELTGQADLVLTFPPTEGPAAEWNVMVWGDGYTVVTPGQTEPEAV